MTKPPQCWPSLRTEEPKGSPSPLEIQPGPEEQVHVDPLAQMLAQIATDAAADLDWYRRYEHWDHGTWRQCHTPNDIFRALGWGMDTLRRKQPTVTLHADIPEPAREPLEKGQRYFMPNPVGMRFIDPPVRIHMLCIWEGDNIDLYRLHRGLVHRTEAAAVAHANACYPFREDGAATNGRREND